MAIYTGSVGPGFDPDCDRYGFATGGKGAVHHRAAADEGWPACGGPEPVTAAMQGRLLRQLPGSGKGPILQLCQMGNPWLPSVTRQPGLLSATWSRLI